MPVFRLTPLEGTETSPRWRASSMRPYCLWIRARDEQEARGAVAKATAIRPMIGDPGSAPWKDSGLVACEYDDSKDVAAGIIYVRRVPVVPLFKEQPRLSA